MWNRLRFWLRREHEEGELDEEIRAHLAIDAGERAERGEPPNGARLAARRSFGNVAKIREETRESWGWAEFERLVGDFRHGLRMLRRAPAWTGVVVATLTLGIGLSTAIFGVVYGVLLKPLPYPDAHRLMAIWNSAPVAAYQRYNVNGLNWLTWRERSRSFEDIALARLIKNFNLTGTGEPERIQAASTSWNLFRVLQVQPLMGRVFTEDEQKSGANVAVLSYWLWKGRFGGDPRILERMILLNGERYEAIGVMPADFEYPTPQFELWTPLYLPPDELQPGINNNYVAIGRLKPSVTVAQAQADMSAVMRQFANQHPGTNKILGGGYVDALVEPLLTSNTLQIRTALWVLMAAVGCLLLIGCFNLGILLIARASSRAKEIAIRAALGAANGRLLRQMLAEVIPLSLAGAAGGIALAWLLLRAFPPLFPSQIPRIESAGLNFPVLAFATAVSLLAVLLAALLPAHLAGRFRLSGSMQQDSRGVTGGTKARSILVMAQVTVTVVLLFAGTLFARSLLSVLRVNPGFSTDGVLTMHLTVTRAKYPEDAQVSNYYDRIRDRVKAMSGVVAAGFVNRLPLSGIDQTGPVEFEDQPGRYIDTDWRSATPGYFEAAGIPLKRGRLFTELDHAGLASGRGSRRTTRAQNVRGSKPHWQARSHSDRRSTMDRNCRSYRTYSQCDSGERCAAADLLARIAANPGPSRIRRSNPWPSRVIHGRRDRTDPQGRSRPARLRCANHGRVDVANPRYPQSDYLGGHIFRYSLAGSRLPRTIRRFVVHQRIACARVWNSHGAGSQPRACQMAGTRARRETGARRLCGWPCAGLPG